MKIEIWSDVMCPFCYIGKRHLEKAMEDLPFSGEIEIQWKSFQLNPEYRNTNNESLYDYLARVKGMSIDQAKQLTENVTAMANQVGLAFDFDRSIPANSFDAHRLLHFAKSIGMQHEAEEALFQAHLIQGKDIADRNTLIAIAEVLGLPKEETLLMLTSNRFEQEVRFDIYESQQIGVSGVPFFVFDQKYALSGAQPIATFADAIKQSFTAWKAAQPA